MLDDNFLCSRAAAPSVAQTGETNNSRRIAARRTTLRAIRQGGSVAILIGLISLALTACSDVSGAKFQDMLHGRDGSATAADFCYQDKGTRVNEMPIVRCPYADRGRLKPQSSVADL